MYQNSSSHDDGSDGTDSAAHLPPFTPIGEPVSIHDDGTKWLEVLAQVRAAFLDPKGDAEGGPTP